MKTESMAIGGIRVENRSIESEWIRRYTGDWEILFILEGEIHVSYHGREISLSAEKRHILIYSPGFVYRFKECRGTKFIFVHLKLRKEIENLINLSGPIEGLEIFSPPPALHRRIKRDILEITDLVKPRLNKYDMIATALAEAVILRITESGAAAGSDSFRIARSFTMLTQRHNFSMEEIAEKCGLSISAFYKLFKQETGITPRMYREEFKIHEAAMLLTETDLTLSDIAEEINMYDQYYLSKRFRKIKGISPSAYRKMMRRTTTAAAEKNYRQQ